MKQRLAIANDFTKRFHYDVPLAVDAIDNLARTTPTPAGRSASTSSTSTERSCTRASPARSGYHPEESLETWRSRERFRRVMVQPSAGGAVFLRSAGLFGALVPELVAAGPEEDQDH